MTESDDEIHALAGERLQALHSMVLESTVLSEEARSALSGALNTLITVQVPPRNLLTRGSAFGGPFMRRVDMDLTTIPRVARDGQNVRAFQVARRLTSSLVGYLGLLQPKDLDGTGLDEADITDLASSLGAADQRLAVVEAESDFASTHQILERIRVAADEAEGARDVAVEAAGVAGSASLSKYFETYARSEIRSANVFRWLTVGAILAAIGAAFFLPHPPLGEWPEIVYRLATLLGIAALGTYFGRQAGQHRHVGNWARSIQVQLQSFPAFAENASGDVKNAAFDVLAKRVLGAIPGRASSSKKEPTIEVSQVIELLTNVTKRLN